MPIVTSLLRHLRLALVVCSMVVMMVRGPGRTYATQVSGPKAPAAGRAEPGDSPGEYIVVFKNHSSDLSAVIDRWHRRFSSNSMHYAWHQQYQFSKFSAARVTLNSTSLKVILDDPAVKYIEANKVIRVNAPQPDVELELDDACKRLVEGPCRQQSTGSSLWGLSRVAMRSRTSLTLAKYTYLEGDGAGVDVYVVDTGVYAEHSEFGGRAAVQFVASEFADEGPEDLHGHGTHVSGTIAGRTYGIAKRANVIGVKVLGKNGAGTLGGLLEGLEWVHEDFQSKLLSTTKRVKAVVNLSLGGAPGEIETLDEAAITLISEAGLPFVVSAGNDDTDACLVSPARVSVAITTGATSKNDMLSSFSNFGPCVDILAPGELVLSAFIGTPTTSATMSGTSMATPHVTGVIARYLSQTCAMRPSPSAIKAWVQDMSTKSVVDVQNKLSTPNRLIYMFCLAGTVFDKVDIADIDHLLFVYIGMGLLGLLCLLVLTFVCVTYNKIKSVTTAQTEAGPPRQFYAPRTYNTFSRVPAGDDCHVTA